MEAETAIRDEGWGPIVTRLSEVLFVAVLRAYMGHNPHSTGALMALTESQLGAALRAIHSDPAEPWSVEELAARAGMSRTVFAERFRHHLGLPPLRYVTLWRMHKARAILAHTQDTVGEVAWAVGYTS